MTEDKITNNQDDTQENVSEVHINPLLARVEMPGSTYQIPSRGIFYTNGELRDDVEMGEINVKPMSAYDEILMKTPDSLFSGEAVEKVFARCIPQVLKPLDLLAKDVDFLLACLRIVTYGETMEISYTHDCKDAKNNSYNVNINKFIKDTKKIDATKVGSIYSVVLENGQNVKLMPTKYRDILKLLQNTRSENESPEDELEFTIQVVQSIIHSVDGITDKKMITEWLKKISAQWVSTLAKSIDAASDFGPDFTFKTKCKDCKKQIELQAPVNPISFFI